MSLKEALEDKMFDLRLRDKLVARGKLKVEQVEEYLKNLPDDHKAYEMLDVSENN